MKHLLKQTLSLALSGLALLALAGCGSSSVPTASPVTAPKQTVKAACATCIYNMPGVQGCQLAVKIDNTPYLVTGLKVDAHKLGLCEGEKNAEIAGQIQNGKFVAQSFELKP